MYDQQELRLAMLQGARFLQPKGWPSSTACPGVPPTSEAEFSAVGGSRVRPTALHLVRWQWRAAKAGAPAPATVPAQRPGASAARAWLAHARAENAADAQPLPARGKRVVPCWRSARRPEVGAGDALWALESPRRRGCAGFSQSSKCAAGAPGSK